MTLISPVEFKSLPLEQQQSYLLTHAKESGIDKLQCIFDTAEKVVPSEQTDSSSIFSAAASMDRAMGTKLERTTTPSTTKVKNKDGYTTEVVSCSPEFISQDAKVTEELKILAAEHKYDNVATEAKLNENSYYDGARRIIAGVEYTPEVIEEIVSEANKYDDTQDAFVNEDACFLGMKNFLESGYLENPANSEMAELARQANYTKTKDLTPDEVEARHIIDAKLASWQPSQVQHAKEAEQAIAKYKSEHAGEPNLHENAVKSQIGITLDNRGFPLLDEGQPIIVPSEYTKITGRPQ